MWHEFNLSVRQRGGLLLGSSEPDSHEISNAVIIITASHNWYGSHHYHHNHVIITMINDHRHRPLIYMWLVVQLVGSEFSRKFQQGCRSSEGIVAICLYFLSTSPKFVLLNMNQTIFNSSGRFKHNFDELGRFWVFPENQLFCLFSSSQFLAPAWHLS